MVYLKDIQPSNNETILENLDLHNYDDSNDDLNELKTEVDFVAKPTYLDRDLHLLPFDTNNGGTLAVTEFYNRLINIESKEYPAFNDKYEKVMKCFEDRADTFNSIKKRIK